MEIILNISDRLFDKDINDRFQDFFGRVIADIADTLNSDDSCGICGRYELETAELLRQAFKKGKYGNKEN